MWNGDLALEEVRLLPGPIAGPPLCVSGGSLRRLVLQFPWKSLKTKPVIVEVDALEVIYGPQHAMSGRERATEAEAALERKREILRIFDDEGDPTAEPEPEMASSERPWGESKSLESPRRPGDMENDEVDAHKSFSERMMDSVSTYPHSCCYFVCP